MGVIVPSANFGSDPDFLSTLERKVVNESKKGGNLETLTDGKPLYYPSDILSVDNWYPDGDNEITQWIEFRMFFRQNSGLSSTISKFLKGGTNTLESLGENLGEAISNETNGESQQKLLELDLFSNQEQSQQTFKQDTRLSPATENSGDSIFLYVPGKIQYTDGFKYESAALGNMRAITEGSAAGSVIALNALRKLAGAVDKVGESVIGELNSGAALSASIGVVQNPKKEQLFQEVESRSFEFNFTFIPRNKKEAETVGKIIKVFRFHAHPEASANGAFFNFPSEFEIKYRTFRTDEAIVQDNPILPKIGRCFLQKIQTDFTPNEVYYSLKNGIPPQINLSLSFVEAEVITRQHISEGY